LVSPRKVTIVINAGAAGGAFQTKRGYKGTKLDSMWGRFMCDAIITDDEELASIALESCIADISTVVEGGEVGSPYIVGTYGFYTENSFDAQAAVLQKNERIINEGREYLSQAEWAVVDKGLRRIAAHGAAKLVEACRGDTLAMLAVRNRALRVCHLLVSRNCDPLQQNEAGETLKDIVRAYNILVTNDIIFLNKEIEAATKGIIIPSVAEDFIRKSDKLLEEQRDLKRVLALLMDVLNTKLKDIENFKWEKKKLELRKLVLFCAL
jgi:hypothetical protein